MTRICTLLALALLLPACTDQQPVATDTAAPSPTVKDDSTATPPAGGVRNSVQQTYRPGTADTPSKPVAPCAEEKDSDCFTGQPLVLQAMPVGATAAEPTIGVAPDGTAYFAASSLVLDTDFVWGVSRTNVMKSEDGGLSWTSIQPNIAGETFSPGNADPMLYVDTDTGRVFVFDLSAVCHWLSFSDDQGATWTTNPIACGNVPIDHQTIVTAKPIGAVPTSGYPNMLIWCSNRIVDATCGRSFDGGITWSPGGTPYLPTDESGTACSSIAGHLDAGPEGRLYLPSGHCRVPEVSVSEDGGLTWEQYIVHPSRASNAHTAVATDEDGNVYTVWIDALQQAFLAYSTDYGKSWSEPMMVSPPGVKLANFPVIAAGAPGAVAINMPTTTDEGTPGNLTWDQTLTVSTNVLSADPIFQSATANDPAVPIHRGACHGRCGGLWDFLDIQISDEGELWASASFDCGPACQEGKLEADKVGQGVAIRQIGGPKLR